MRIRAAREAQKKDPQDGRTENAAVPAGIRESRDHTFL